MGPEDRKTRNENNTGTKKGASPPKGRKKLDFKTPSPANGKPLKGKNIYLDLLKNFRGTKTVEGDLKFLGANVVPFFSKDIDYVITSQGHPKEYDKDEEEGSAASPAVSTPSPFNLGDGRGVNSPQNESSGTSDANKAAAIPRGRTIADRAKTSQGRGSANLISNAKTWGVKIKHIDSALIWIAREKERLPKEQKAPTKQTGAKGKLPVVPKKLKSPFIKFEATNKHYRPLYKQLTAWPKIHPNAPTGTCPFDGRTFHSGLQPERAEREEGEERDGCPEKSIGSDKPKQDSSKQPGKTDSGDFLDCSNIVTAGEMKRMKEAQRKAEQKRGFCELCSVKYDDIEKHVRVAEHQKFARSDKNYKDLDELITKNGPTLHSFIDGLVKTAKTKKDMEKETKKKTAIAKPSSPLGRLTVLRGRKSPDQQCASKQDKSPKNTQQRSKQSPRLRSCRRSTPENTPPVEQKNDSAGDGLAMIDSIGTLSQGKATNLVSEKRNSAAVVEDYMSAVSKLEKESLSLDATGIDVNSNGSVASAIDAEFEINNNVTDSRKAMYGSITKSHEILSPKNKSKNTVDNDGDSLKESLDVAESESVVLETWEAKVMDCCVVEKCQVEVNVVESPETLRRKPKGKKRRQSHSQELVSPRRSLRGPVSPVQCGQSKGVELVSRRQSLIAVSPVPCRLSQSGELVSPRRSLRHPVSPVPCRESQRAELVSPRRSLQRPVFPVPCRQSESMELVSPRCSLRDSVPGKLSESAELVSPRRSLRHPVSPVPSVTEKTTSSCILQNNVSADFSAYSTAQETKNRNSTRTETQPSNENKGETKSSFRSISKTRKLSIGNAVTRTEDKENVDDDTRSLVTSPRSKSQTVDEDGDALIAVVSPRRKSARLVQLPGESPRKIILETPPLKKHCGHSFECDGMMEMSSPQKKHTARKLSMHDEKSPTHSSKLCCSSPVSSLFGLGAHLRQARSPVSSTYSPGAMFDSTVLLTPRQQVNPAKLKDTPRLKRDPSLSLNVLLGSSPRNKTILTSAENFIRGERITSPCRVVADRYRVDREDTCAKFQKVPGYKDQSGSKSRKLSSPDLRHRSSRGKLEFKSMKNTNHTETLIADAYDTDTKDEKDSIVSAPDIGDLIRLSGRLKPWDVDGEEEPKVDTLIEKRHGRNKRDFKLDMNTVSMKNSIESTECVNNSNLDSLERPVHKTHNQHVSHKSLASERSVQRTTRSSSVENSEASIDVAPIFETSQPKTVGSPDNEKMIPEEAQSTGFKKMKKSKKSWSRLTEDEALKVYLDSPLVPEGDRSPTLGAVESADSESSCVENKDGKEMVVSEKLCKGRRSRSRVKDTKFVTADVIGSPNVLITRNRNISLCSNTSMDAESSGVVIQKEAVGFVDEDGEIGKSKSHDTGGDEVHDENEQECRKPVKSTTSDYVVLKIDTPDTAKKAKKERKHAITDRICLHVVESGVRRHTRSTSVKGEEMDVSHVAKEANLVETNSSDNKHVRKEKLSSPRTKQKKSITSISPTHCDNSSADSCSTEDSQASETEDHILNGSVSVKARLRNSGTCSDGNVCDRSVEAIFKRRKSERLSFVSNEIAESSLLSLGTVIRANAYSGSFESNDQTVRVDKVSDPEKDSPRAKLENHKSDTHVVDFSAAENEEKLSNQIPDKVCVHQAKPEDNSSLHCDASSFAADFSLVPLRITRKFFMDVSNGTFEKSSRSNSPVSSGSQTVATPKSESGKTIMCTINSSSQVTSADQAVCDKDVVESGKDSGVDSASTESVQQNSGTALKDSVKCINSKKRKPLKRTRSVQIKILDASPRVGKVSRSRSNRQHSHSQGHAESHVRSGLLSPKSMTRSPKMKKTGKISEMSLAKENLEREFPSESEINFVGDIQMVSDSDMSSTWDSNCDTYLAWKCKTPNGMSTSDSYSSAAETSQGENDQLGQDAHGELGVITHRRSARKTASGAVEMKEHVSPRTRAQNSNKHVKTAVARSIKLLNSSKSPIVNQSTKLRVTRSSNESVCDQEIVIGDESSRHPRMSKSPSNLSNDKQECDVESEFGSSQGSECESSQDPVSSVRKRKWKGSPKKRRSARRKRVRMPINRSKLVGLFQAQDLDDSVSNASGKKGPSILNDNEHNIESSFRGRGRRSGSQFQLTVGTVSESKYKKSHANSEIVSAEEADENSLTEAAGHRSGNGRRRSGRVKGRVKYLESASENELVNEAAYGSVEIEQIFVEKEETETVVSRDERQGKKGTRRSTGVKDTHNEKLETNENCLSSPRGVRVNRAMQSLNNAVSLNESKSDVGADAFESKDSDHVLMETSVGVCPITPRGKKIVSELVSTTPRSSRIVSTTPRSSRIVSTTPRRSRIVPTTPRSSRKDAVHRAEELLKAVTPSKMIPRRNVLTDDSKRSSPRKTGSNLDEESPEVSESSVGKVQNTPHGKNVTPKRQNLPRTCTTPKQPSPSKDNAMTTLASIPADVISPPVGSRLKRKRKLTSEDAKNIKLVKCEGDFDCFASAIQRAKNISFESRKSSLPQGHGRDQVDGRNKANSVHVGDVTSPRDEVLSRVKPGGQSFADIDWDREKVDSQTIPTGERIGTTISHSEDKSFADIDWDCEKVDSLALSTGEKMRTTVSHSKDNSFADMDWDCKKVDSRAMPTGERMRASVSHSNSKDKGTKSSTSRKPSEIFIPFENLIHFSSKAPTAQKVKTPKKKLLKKLSDRPKSYQFSIVNRRYTTKTLGQSNNNTACGCSANHGSKTCAKQTKKISNMPKQGTKVKDKNTFKSRLSFGLNKVHVLVRSSPKRAAALAANEAISSPQKTVYGSVKRKQPSSPSYKSSAHSAARKKVQLAKTYSPSVTNRLSRGTVASSAKVRQKLNMVKKAEGNVSKSNTKQVGASASGKVSLRERNDRMKFDYVDEDSNDPYSLV